MSAHHRTPAMSHAPTSTSFTFTSPPFAPLNDTFAFPTPAPLDDTFTFPTLAPLTGTWASSRPHAPFSPSSLLDLPWAVNANILKRVPGSMQSVLRNTCVAFRDMVDAGMRKVDITWSFNPEAPPTAAPPQLSCLTGFLARMPDLRQLKARSDLTPLRSAALPSLGPLLAAHGALLHLDLLGTCSMIDDLSPLTGCPALRLLNLTHGAHIHDLAPIAACRSLTFLNLDACTLITSIAPLASLPSLQSLHLPWCRLITSVAPLASCALLEELDVSFCYGINDAERLCLPACPALARLACCMSLSSEVRKALKAGRGTAFQVGRLDPERVNAASGLL